MAMPNVYMKLLTAKVFFKRTFPLSKSVLSEKRLQMIAVHDPCLEHRLVKPNHESLSAHENNLCTTMLMAMRGYTKQDRVDTENQMQNKFKGHNHSRRFRLTLSSAGKSLWNTNSNESGYAYGGSTNVTFSKPKLLDLGLKTQMYAAPRSDFSTSTRNFEAVRIDGKSIALDIKDEIKAEVQMLVGQGLRPPHLTVLLVGNDPASIVYVRNKARVANYTGITCDVLRLPGNISERALIKELHLLNSLPEVDGILVQLPLPPQMNERTVCDAVLPEKDVDGFNVLNIGRFCVDQDAFMPATPAGVLEIIHRLEMETCGKNVVVCGRSKNVGMPIAMQLHSSTQGGNRPGNATTVICHRYTPKNELIKFTRAADILITATGVPGLITADMVREGVVVIDVGITRVEDHRGRARLVGDVDYQEVSKKASMITPVPGGVGPVTVAMVIKNTLIAYKKRLGS